MSDGTRRLRAGRGVAAAGAVATVVVASVAMTSWLASGDNGPDPRGSGGPAGSAVRIHAGWRVEAYRGVEVRVPPSWGWGGVPTLGESAALMFCGDGAFAVPGGSEKEAASMPYVGRAGYAMTDLCVEGSAHAPVAPFVWLGSPLEIGSSDLHGVPVETVEAGGVRVSVGDRDGTEREQILAGVEAARTGMAACRQTVDLAEPGDTIAGIRSVAAVTVCAYRLDAGGVPFLGYSARIDGADAQHVLDQLRAAPPTPGDCADAAGSPPADAVVLRLREQGRGADVIVRLGGCAGYDMGDGGLRQLTRSNVSSWVTDGVGLYVDGGMVGNALSGLLHTPPG